MRERLQLVIFDCDGVLVDSEGISDEVLGAMLTEQGLPTTARQARAEYQGLMLSDLLAKAQQRLGRPLPDGWLSDFQHRRAAAFEARLRPIDGAAETVEAIAAAGVKVCVASQGKLEKTRLSLRLTGLDRLFPESVRFSAYCVARGKPYPDLFLRAAEAMGAEAADCAVVEDSVSGVQAAVAAGMRAVGYAEETDGRVLREQGAEIIHSLTELPDVLGLI